jgi:BirA family transcriptional regulator, biotin operon repressor / biotin---[acetyl-CoA-carboxylase] ligase
MPESILNLLKSSDPFVSGEDISARLGITRAAVWKKITALRKKGFIIEAIPSKGYRLVSSPDLARDELLDQTQGELWKELMVYDSVESTNDLAMSLAASGIIASGTVIIADRQTKGKGRLGRTWESPAGLNIYLSIVIQPELEPKNVTMLTIVTAVAGAAALRKTCNVPVSIKWPNDLVIADKKIGGILTEVRADPDRINLAVIGIGINVNMTDKDFPEEIRYSATSVKQETGTVFSRNEIIIQLLREFEYWYGLLITGGRVPLLDAWKKSSSTLGRKVKATIGETSISGIAEDIDDNGMLILKIQSGEKITISAGDLTLLR